ncbi:MAG: glycosyltransferase family 87 protein [Chitinivibrionales bacterium]|nr:glycosyltransferase family 87 protein [Chitinivibrionales bacterium]
MNPQSFANQIKKELQRPAIIAGVYLLAALAMTISKLAHGSFMHDGIQYQSFQNFVIFKQSFFHLIAQKDLYAAYPMEQWDLFKYSPTFALFMGIFAWMPHWCGALAWNLLNTGVLVGGILTIPFVKDNLKSAMAWLVLVELVTSLANAQSNALIAGLIVLGFAAFERGHNGRAILLLMLSAFIKIYSGAFLLFILFYPRKTRSIFYAFLWGALFLALPLMVVSLKHLMLLYENWWALLRADQAVSLGLSVNGVLHAVFGTDPSRKIVTLIGALLFLAPLIRYKKFAQADFRLQLLASLLIWITIFNHKAESPTYILAMTGVALWYFTSRKSLSDSVLVIAALVLTSLSSTDLFPPLVRDRFFIPYRIKALPCILVWLTITFDLLCTNPSQGNDHDTIPARSA